MAAFLGQLTEPAQATSAAEAESEQGVARDEVGVALQPARVVVYPGTIGLLAGDDGRSQLVPPAVLLAVGITTWVVVQAFLNLGAVMALLPVTGVTLPFLSLGGSSVVVTLAAMGILMNIARQGTPS